MHLKDLLEQWGETNVTLLTVATNGLRPTKDKLLAVSISECKAPDYVAELHQFFNRTTGVELQQSSTHHGITIDDMLAQGIEEDDFKQAVEDIFNGDRLVFTYRSHHRCIACIGCE